jgi:hypothetical protein
VPRVRSPPPALSERLGMFSRMKTAERSEARRMRRDEGRSMKEIGALLGVSKSSVSLWVRDIELTIEQHAALQARNGLHERQCLACAAMSAKARARRVAWQQDGRQRARSFGQRYAGGCMLYWAEGSRSRNKIVFTNSDPAMARFFVEFVRDFSTSASNGFESLAISSPTMSLVSERSRAFGSARSVSQDVVFASRP